MTASALEIAVLVHHTPEGDADDSRSRANRSRDTRQGHRRGRLAVYIFSLVHRLFRRERVTHEISGSEEHEPQFSISPVSDSTGSDTVYLLESYQIYVYSVVTGQKLRVIAAPTIAGRGTVIVGMSVSGDHRYLAVATPESETHVYLWQLSFPQAPDVISKSASRSSRFQGSRRSHELEVIGAMQIRIIVEEIVAKIVKELPQEPQNLQPKDRPDELKTGGMKFALSDYGSISPTSWVST